MEELSLFLGRVSPNHHEAHLSLSSDNTKISRLHACLYYDPHHSCYCIVNLSKNGLKIKQPKPENSKSKDSESPSSAKSESSSSSSKFVEHLELYTPIPLSNPAVLDIQGVLLYITVYHITAGQTSKLSTSTAKNAAAKRPKGEPKRGNNNERSSSTYATKIEEALMALGGSATQPEISKYIEENYPEEITGKKTWRNSVSGVLSHNSRFVQEPIIDDRGRKERKYLWRLKGYNGEKETVEEESDGKEGRGEKRKATEESKKGKGKKKRKMK
eukprot:TRINITY_DN6486_c0_g1_i1.p1 TRINITY_DN6486_c0_g1~~TRINITY_DN6486_c0_g1_i1.p1  ORF type:complete len:272 (-),score=93.57 TRINITY_DN6486_c0_g1_i1:82-897(-)